MFGFYLKAEVETQVSKYAFSYWVSLGSFGLEWLLSSSFITLTFWEEYILLIAAQFGFTECTLMIRFRYCVSGTNAEELVWCPLCMISGVMMMPVGTIMLLVVIILITWFKMVSVRSHPCEVTIFPL